MLCKIFSSKTSDKQKLNNATNELHKVIRQRGNEQSKKTEIDILREQYMERRKKKSEPNPGRRKTDYPV